MERGKHLLILILKMPLLTIASVTIWRPYQSGTKPNLVAKILATNFGDRLA